jgi:hypothetical protein
MTRHSLFGYLSLVGLLINSPAKLLEVDAAIFTVGPSQTYSTIGAALANRVLGPGDEVWIYAKPTPYNEKFVINAVGTAASPVVIKGIADGAGSRPVIDGTNAVTEPTLNYWNGARGLLKIGGANVPALPPGSAVPQHIRIEGLEFRNARPGISFTDFKGVGGSYAKNAACIFVEEGKNIALVGNVLTGCGNGLFVSPGVEDILIESNHFFDNGIAGSILEHQAYTEALGIVYRFNRFDPLCNGCLGNNLKDRSGGLVVAYNVIQGGSRQLDLVDTDSATIANNPRYRTTYVYGNTLVESEGPDNRQILHYGGDSGNEAQYRKGTLHFYHNTIVSSRVGRTTFIRLSSEAETCDARNNIIFVTAAGSELELLAENRGQLIMRNNWLKPGNVLFFDKQGTGSVSLIDNLNGTEPGFADPNFGSSLNVRLSKPLGPSAELASGAPPVSLEYVSHLRSQARTSSDIGAYGYSGIGPVPTLPISPVGQPLAPAAVPIQNPPTSTVNPPSSMVNPPTSTLNPPTSTPKSPISTVNSPTVTLNPPTSKVNPPTRTANPPSTAACASCRRGLLGLFLQGVTLKQGSGSTCRSQCASRRRKKRALAQGWVCGSCA